MSGKGHPLPGSDEARHNEIPENLERDKGRGDDSQPVVQPGEAVTPEGKSYPYDDLGQGPQGGLSPREGVDEPPLSGSGPEPSNDEFAADQARHQDRGQSAAEDEAEGA